MVDLIPREVLFGNPERVSPHISPDGSQLAWIAPRDGVLNVWVAPVGGPAWIWDGAKAVTEDTDRGPARVRLGAGTAGTCCTCRTPAEMKLRCTTSTWRRWRGAT